MANDLEEQLDLSLAYTAKPRELQPEWQTFFRSLAAELGVEGLALELERAAAAVSYAAMCVDADDPDRLRAVHGAKAEALE